MTSPILTVFFGGVAFPFFAPLRLAHEKPVFRFCLPFLIHPHPTQKSSNRTCINKVTLPIYVQFFRERTKAYQKITPLSRADIGQ